MRSVTTNRTLVVILTNKPLLPAQSAKSAPEADTADLSAGGVATQQAHGFDFQTFNQPLSALAAMMALPKQQEGILVIDTTLPNPDLNDWLRLLAMVEEQKNPSSRYPVVLVTSGPLSPALVKVQQRLRCHVCVMQLELAALSAYLRTELDHSAAA